MRDQRIDSKLIYCASALVSLALHAIVFFLPIKFQPANVNYTHGISALQIVLQPLPPAPATEPAQIMDNPKIPTADAGTIPSIAFPVDPAPSEPPPLADDPRLPVENAESPDTALAESAYLEADADKGVDVPARLNASIYPVYPRKSRQLNEAGRVELRFNVTQKGQATDIVVVKSSGFQRLDTAAISAIEQAEFVPAQRFGQNVASIVTMSFLFRLTP